jgi:hypothetical protein
MDAQLMAWKRAANELAAAQAMPGLRAAAAKGADRRSKAIAERRFAAIRDALHAATLPRFGRREDPEQARDALMKRV